MTSNANSTDKLRDQTHQGEDSINQNLCLDGDIEDTFYGRQTNDLDYDQEITNRQYDQYITRFYNQGFRAAMLAFNNEERDINNSNDIHILQKSFDQGYQTAFVISKQLFTISTGVKTYLELLEKDNIDKRVPTENSTAHLFQPFSVHLVSNIEKLNLDLDIAIVELGQLVNDEVEIQIISKSKTSTTETNNNNSKERIAELDEKWRSKINNTLNLQNLQIRASELLGIKF